MTMHFLICDDHAILREAIADTLEGGFPGCEIRQAASFPEAWRMAQDFAPDLAICDLVMPGADPLAGVTTLLGIMRGRPVLVLTGTEDDQLMLRLFESGVAGFAGKNSGSAVILAAIRLLMAGGRYLPPRLLDLVGAPHPDHRPLCPEAPRLTAQQRRVLLLVAEGKQNKVIAQELGVAPSTIKSHLEHAMRQLGAANRIEAWREADRLGLLRAP